MEKTSNTTPRRSSWIVLVALVVLTLVCRYYKFFDHIRWVDTGLEVSMAYHMNVFREYSTIGTPTSSLHVFLPPWYIYFITLLLQAVSNVSWVIVITTFIHAIAIAPFFLTALFLFDTTTATLGSLLFLLSYPFVQAADVLQSQNFVLPILLFGTYFFVKAYQKGKYSDTLLASFFLILATTINYAAVPIVSFLF